VGLPNCLTQIPPAYMDRLAQLFQKCYICVIGSNADDVNTPTFEIVSSGERSLFVLRLAIGDDDNSVSSRN
jgi:hypothetical protein